MRNSRNTLIMSSNDPKQILQVGEGRGPGGTWTPGL